MLFDGECPLCVKEVKLLKLFNRNPDKVEFIDITVGEYSSEAHQGIEYSDAIGALHVIDQQNKVIIEPFQPQAQLVSLVCHVNY